MKVWIVTKHEHWSGGDCWVDSVWLDEGDARKRESEIDNERFYYASVEEHDAK